MAGSVSGPVAMRGISIPRRKEEKGRKNLNSVVGMLQWGGLTPPHMFPRGGDIHWNLPWWGSGGSAHEENFLRKLPCKIL
jgi:hypothetical protein